MNTVVTHSGGFHSDDVFAVAAFQLLLGNENMQVIRTRDEGVIASGDYVVDVGGVYDHETRRYDHHQVNAPVRENKIPYAGFGLVWKHYGEEICGSKEVADKIEEKLCVAVDASDSAINIWEPGKFDLRPTEWDDILQSWRAEPTLDEDPDYQFMLAVDVAREYLKRRIQRGRVKIHQKKKAQEIYESTPAADRRIIISDEYVPRSEFIQYPEVQMVVFPRESDVKKGWVAVAVQKNEHDYETRVRFPESWAGQKDAALAEISGLVDAAFCHKDRYMFIAGSKDSAIVAAQIVI
jgi:uncharacterized UPF0160 family protein